MSNGWDVLTVDVQLSPPQLDKKTSHRVAGVVTGTIAAIICSDWLGRYSQLDTTVHCEKSSLALKLSKKRGQRWEDASM